MAKIVDITDKLNFEEKPQLKIKDQVLTVNNEAEKILKIIPLAERVEEGSAEALAQIVPMLFDEENCAKFYALGLSFEDFGTSIKEAVQVAAGVAVGEAQTRATT